MNKAGYIEAVLSGVSEALHENGDIVVQYVVATSR